MVDVTALAGAALALAFPGILIAAAACDLARYLIPNTLSIALVGVFLPAALVAGLSPESMLFHVLAGTAVFAAGFVLFACNAIGGGDVKLLAAAATWTGWSTLAPFLLAVALAGGLVALVLISARLIWSGDGPGRTGPLGRLLSPGQGVPYATAIALAGLVVMPRMALMDPLLTMIGVGNAP